MTILLDHLAAVIAGTVLLGALAIFQISARGEAVAAVDQYRATVLSGELSTTLERELENIRSRAQTEQAFALVPGALGFSAETYRFRLDRATTSDGTEYTRQLSFPTLADPSAGSGSEIHVLTYSATPTGATARVDGRDRALLRITRSVFARGGPIRETTTHEGVVDFDVTVFGPGGVPVEETPELAVLPSRMQVAIEHAPETGGQAASIRHVRTVRVPGAGAAALGMPDPSTPGGIPSLPGDPDYDPTSEPVPTRDWETPENLADGPAPDWGAPDLGDPPITGIPITDTPITDTPITDTPITDTPITGTPPDAEPCRIGAGGENGNGGSTSVHCPEGVQ